MTVLKMLLPGRNENHFFLFFYEIFALLLNSVIEFQFLKKQM